MKAIRTWAVLCALAFSSIASASIGGIGWSVGGIGSGGTGFLPTGHYVTAQQPMRLVFPRPDTETASYAREHWAYWDGTNDVPFDLALGVSFGAYPYVFTLQSGPPGMTIEQSTYSGFRNAAYGRLLWHPQGNISSPWSGTVTVLVTDQERNTLTLSFHLATDSTTTHFIFVSPTGAGTACTYSAPCLFSTAFTSGSFPGASCYAFGGSYSGTANFPAGLALNATNYPDALIGIPGQTVTLDATTSAVLMNPGYYAPDWYMENITANGYDATAVDRLIELGGTRTTFDQVTWTNSGYGTGTNSNMSMFESSANTPPHYLFITDSTETNRESGHVGNNFGFLDLYSYTDALVQRNYEDSPGSSLDGVFFFKSDIEDGEMRENESDADATHGFDYGQVQYTGAGSDESDYNLGIGSLGSMWVGYGGNWTWGPVAFYRNTIISGTGVGFHTNQNSYNLEGPGGPGVITLASAAGGTLTSGSTYYYGMTSLGVSGESSTIIGTNGNGNVGTVAGESNIANITVAAGDGSVALSWAQEPGATGYNIYRGSSATTLQLLTTIANPATTSYTDAGSATSATAPPASPGNALSSYRFSLLSNAFSTTYTPAPPPTGSAFVDSGNEVDSSVANTIIQANGQLNPAYSGYSALIGQVGYQIQ